MNAAAGGSLALIYHTDLNVSFPAVRPLCPPPPIARATHSARAVPPPCVLRQTWGVLLCVCHLLRVGKKKEDASPRFLCSGLVLYPIVLYVPVYKVSTLMSAGLRRRPVPRPIGIDTLCTK